MRCPHVLSISSLIFLSISLTAHADSNVCDHLYEAVCSNGASSDRANRLSAQKQLLETELGPQLSQLAKEQGLPDLDPKDPIGSTLKGIAPTFGFKTDAIKQSSVAILSVIEKAVLARIQIPDFQKIRGRVELMVLGKSNLSDATKKDMIKRIEGTRIVLPMEYVRDYAVGGDETYPVLDAVMSDDAFNIGYDEISNPGDLPPQGSVIVPLYGMLLAEIRNDGAPAAIDFVLSHETSHSVDFDHEGPIYQPLTACMQQSYSANFKEWDEIAADFWGTQAFAQELTDAKLTPEQALERVTRSYQILCDTSGEDGDGGMGSVVFENVHPSGEFRINNIAAKNPQLRAVLGCAPMEKPAQYCQPGNI